MTKNKQTPLMQQYFKIKEKYPNTIILFQVGDFYELFFDDAIIVSKFLAIALTKRGKNNGKDIPLCGVPIHALNHYLIKLIKGGFKVAICDQLTKPQPGKVVERGVTRVFTAGTLTDTSMLDEKTASYIACFFPTKEAWGLVFTELLTAQLFATTIPINSYKMIESELIRFFPDEIILPKIKNIKTFEKQFKQMGYLTSISEYNPNDSSNSEISKAWIKEKFNKKILEILSHQNDIKNAIQSLYFYLKVNQEQALSQFQNIHFYKPEDFLILDSATQKNLEIIKNNQDGGRKNTLLQIMDKAKTPMGSRTIKKWLQRPLVDQNKIIERQEFVANLYKKINIMQQIEEILDQINDLERIIGRIALNRANVADYINLKTSLIQLPKLKTILNKNLLNKMSKKIQETIIDFSPLINLLESGIEENTAFNQIIKKGFDLNLDNLRNLVQNSQKEILKLEQEEITKTGINSLKIRYNNISGYYIEITNPNLSLVPAHYIEQQKLVNRKRFVTQELKNLEHKIIKAKNKINDVETKVFEKIKKEVEEYLYSLRLISKSITILDAIFSLAKIAYENNYALPIFNKSGNIQIKEGRHPIVEQKLASQFQSNDTYLNEKEFLWIITGPNMGGKSTYLRQVALICIMAQCGSFVPAQNANLPILDRIFTRIGSGDNLAEDKSTFLVEMEETATICNQATKNSLVILDEVGRGTSTFDGIALAQSIIEYIYHNIKARCIFATHYHELTQLSNNLNGIVNYHMLSKKLEHNLIFLHKIAKGIARESFGLEVAKLANLPLKIIERAQQINNKIQNDQLLIKNKKINGIQSSLFEYQTNNYEEKINQLIDQIEILENKIEQKEIIINQLKQINLNEITPKQAFDFLWKIKKLTI